MDNVVQNIKLEDIIPSDFQNNDKQSLQELANSIQRYGILEPLLLRQKNGKYQIILGNKRYQAAKMIGLETIPALIKNVDDDVFKQYLKINNHQSEVPSTNKFINLNPNPSEEKLSKKKEQNISNTPPPLSNKETQKTPKKNPNNNMNFKMDFNKKNTSDIINLSELNKEEYERDDFKMNNEQMNNNVMNNIGTTPSAPSMQEPTFGGRFFPSLEDEPTNMNLGLNSMNTMSNQPANNLIDLTDLGLDKESPVSPSIPASFQNQEPIPAQTNFNQPQPMVSGISQPAMMNNNPMSMNQEKELMNNPIPDPTSNIINIGNLQNSNPPIQPEPVAMEPQTMGIPQQQNQPPMMEQPQNIPQFDMSQNIAPTEFVQNIEPAPINNMGIAQNEFNMNPTNDFAMNQPTEMISPQPDPAPYVEPSIQQPLPDSGIPDYNLGTEPQPMQMPIEATQPVSVKDIIPVLNTLKNVATSLEAFGYTIRITEEELSTSIKLTIEVNK